MEVRSFLEKKKKKKRPVPKPRVLSTDLKSLYRACEAFYKAVGAERARLWSKSGAKFPVIYCLVFTESYIV